MSIPLPLCVDVNYVGTSIILLEQVGLLTQGLSHPPTGDHVRILELVVVLTERDGEVRLKCIAI